MRFAFRSAILGSIPTDMADEHQELTFVPEPEPERPQTEQEALAQDIEQLAEIKTDLEDLKHLTGSSKEWFVRGMLQGAGAIIGSILMIILLTWFLSIIGVIPGASEIADVIRGYLNQVHR